MKIVTRRLKKLLAFITVFTFFTPSSISLNTLFVYCYNLLIDNRLYFTILQQQSQRIDFCYCRNVTNVIVFFSIFYQCIESLVSRYELLCLCVVPASKINFKHLLILTYFISLSLAFFQKSSQDVLFSDGWLLISTVFYRTTLC